VREPAQVRELVQGQGQVQRRLQPVTAPLTPSHQQIEDLYFSSLKIPPVIFWPVKNYYTTENYHPPFVAQATIFAHNPSGFLGLLFAECLLDTPWNDC
jgi:hypothetical protein